MKKPLTPFIGVSLAELGGAEKLTWCAQFTQAHARMLRRPEYAKQLKQYDPETVDDAAANIYELVGKDTAPELAAETYLAKPGTYWLQPARFMPGHNHG